MLFALKPACNLGIRLLHTGKRYQKNRINISGWVCPTGKWKRTTQFPILREGSSGANGGKTGGGCGLSLIEEKSHEKDLPYRRWPVLMLLHAFSQSAPGDSPVTGAKN